jgi:hypothetical protein
VHPQLLPAEDDNWKGKKNPNMFTACNTSFSNRCYIQQEANGDNAVRSIKRRLTDTAFISYS